MKFCIRCVMPDTKPDLMFDSNGVCSACSGQEYKTAVDWNERYGEFQMLVEWAKDEARRRGNAYDCIVPVSGGKDSHIQTYMALANDLKPLLVSFEPTVPTELGKRNLRNCNRLLEGCDLIQFRKNPHLYRKLAKMAFQMVGDHEWPNHLGVFTVPVQIAVRYNVPLLLWGENSQLEYGSPNNQSMKAQKLDKAWLYEFGGLLGLRPQDIVEMHQTISKEEMTPYL